jgi:S-formylglutathione hydrolase FrmB
MGASSSRIAEIDALAGKLEHGGLQLFCVSSVDTESWYNRQVHPRQRVRRHLQYEDYILSDVVPLIHHLNHHSTIGVTGCSFGAYHGMTFALRQPYVFTWCVTMSGAYDITQFLDGYFDEDCYFLNPPSFCRACRTATTWSSTPQQVGGPRDATSAAPRTRFSGLLTQRHPAQPAHLGRWREARLAILAANGGRLSP